MLKDYGRPVHPRLIAVTLLKQLNTQVADTLLYNTRIVSPHCQGEHVRVRLQRLVE